MVELVKVTEKTLSTCSLDFIKNTADTTECEHSNTEGSQILI